MTTMTERRRMTRNKMYRFIYNSEKPVSKQQIAAATRYSLPTVHQNIAELLEADLIRPGEVQKSTGGRPAVGYTVNRNLRYSIGIAVTANHIRILACDLLQNEMAYRRVNTLTTDSLGIGTQIAEELRKKHYDPESADPKERSRMAAHLARHGYSWAQIESALRQP